MRSQGIGVALEQLGPGGEGLLRAVVPEVLDVARAFLGTTTGDARCC